MYVTVSKNPNVLLKGTGERGRNSCCVGEMRGMTTCKKEDASGRYGTGKRWKFHCVQQ